MDVEMGTLDAALAKMDACHSMLSHHDYARRMDTQFVESEHPREGKGSSTGGQFTSGGGGGKSTVEAPKTKAAKSPNVASKNSEYIRKNLERTKPVSNSRWLQERLRDNYRANFPNMRNYKIVGGEDGSYNCIAWALGIKDKWLGPQMNWPKKYDHGDSLRSFDDLLFKFNASDVSDDSYDEGFVKLALFTHHEEPTHLARLQSDGTWTSKMGGTYTLAHALSEMNGGYIYGNLEKIYKLSVDDFIALRDYLKVNATSRDMDL